MTPDFGHGLQCQFPGILEPVFGDLFLRTSNLDLLGLAFKDLKGLVISSVPPHKEIKELIRIGVDLLKLRYRVQVLVCNFVGSLKGHGLNHVDLEFLLCSGDCPFRNPEELSNFLLGFALPKHLI